MSVFPTPLEAWKRPGAVLLISCYELGHQPLGLAAPLGALRDLGYAPAALDLAVDPLDPGQVEAALFIGISVPMHTALRLGASTAERIRKLNPSAHICLYGLYASLNAAGLLEHAADSVIGGEFLEPLLDWIGALATGEPRAVPGVQNGLAPVLPNLLRPAPRLPSREGLPALARYAQLEHEGRRVLAGYAEATHGCLHTCLHCPITPVYRGRFVALDRATVLGDIREQVRAGAGHITFGDPDFLNGPRHSLLLARAMHAEFPHLSFDVTTKVEHILKHRSVFPELRELGCLFVVSAFESLSDEVLRRLRKGHTAAETSEAVSIIRGAGIELHPTFVAFTPWTRLEDYLELFEFIEDKGLTDTVVPVQLALRLLIPPGSALLEGARDEPWLGEPWAEGFTHRWSHPDPAMDRLQREAAAVAERASRAKEEPARTLHRLHTLACAAASRPEPALPAVLGEPGRRRPARLTEDWFC